MDKLKEKMLGHWIQTRFEVFNLGDRVVVSHKYLTQRQSDNVYFNTSCFTKFDSSEMTHSDSGVLWGDSLKADNFLPNYCFNL
jgi:hypothetical protein